MCECFTSVVSAVAAHTELVRTLTTAPPAKRQPASSTGKLIKIMGLLHYITQPVTTHSSLQRNKQHLKLLLQNCMPFVVLKMFHFPLFFIAFPGFITYSAHLFFVIFFISLSSRYPAVSALFPHSDNCTTHEIYPYYMKNARQ